MGLLTIVAQKFRSLLHYSWLERVLMVAAFFLLGVARLFVLFRPFRSYAWLFGAKAENDVEPWVLDDATLTRAKSIGRAIRAVAKVTPWKSVCLPQAMIACSLLRLHRIPYTVRFGVLPGKRGEDNDPLQAHVWVIAGSSIVTGAPEHRKHTPIASFQVLPQKRRP